MMPTLQESDTAHIISADIIVQTITITTIAIITVTDTITIPGINKQVFRQCSTVKEFKKMQNFF